MGSLGKYTVVATIILGVFVAILGVWSRGQIYPLKPRVSSQQKNPLAGVRPMRPRNFFRPIRDPSYVDVNSAEPFMSEAEVVIGLDINGQRRAYPINYLNDHELVLDTISAVPLLITW